MLAASPTPPVLVSQCAVGYYGDRGEAMIDEETPPGAEWLSQLCVDWQNAALEAEKGGVRVAVFRTGLLLDPDGGLLKQLSLPFKLGVGGPLAGGRPVHALDPPRRRDRPAHLGRSERRRSPESSTRRHRTRSPTASSRRRSGARCTGPSFVPAPKFAVSALRGGELADAISASLRVIPRRALDLGYSFRFTDIEAALRDLFSG